MTERDYHAMLVRVEDAISDLDHLREMYWDLFADYIELRRRKKRTRKNAR